MSDQVYLPSTFNQDECESVYLECKSILDRKKNMTFQASQVERIGTAGVQILLTVGVYCKKNDIECIILDPSQKMIEAIQMLGCTEIFHELGMIS